MTTSIGTPLTLGEEPVSLAEAKLHLRVDGTTEDAYINELVKAARQYVEGFTERQLITATLVQNYDRFTDPLVLPRAPLSSVTSIKYIDLDGVQQTLSPTIYTVDAAVEPGVIHLAYQQSWPSARQIPNAVQVTYQAGYGDASAVPEKLKAAIKFLVGHWYENREAVVVGQAVNKVPFTVESLLWLSRWN